MRLHPRQTQYSYPRRIRLTEDIPPAAGISSLKRLGKVLKQLAIKPFRLNPASREAISKPSTCFKKAPYPPELQRTPCLANLGSDLISEFVQYDLSPVLYLGAPTPHKSVTRLRSSRSCWYSPYELHGMTPPPSPCDVCNVVRLIREAWLKAPLKLTDGFLYAIRTTPL